MSGVLTSSRRLYPSITLPFLQISVLLVLRNDYSRLWHDQYGAASPAEMDSMVRCKLRAAARLRSLKHSENTITGPSHGHGPCFRYKQVKTY